MTKLTKKQESLLNEPLDDFKGGDTEAVHRAPGSQQPEVCKLERS